MKQQKLWVEPVGDIIIARIRGTCTEDLLKACQERVIELTKDTRQVKVLYDTLEMDVPSVEVTLVQQGLESDAWRRFGPLPLRRAILVSNTRVAYLSRIAFGEHGEGAYRVFYKDMAGAMRWLDEPVQAAVQS
ncbi:hypothetical protein AB595_24455 [Massilia sp. WF1]|uniref:hypothetical protein n=1 Tax=unclassified Massilia TaxID=2609279 RepID=UPI00068AF2AA|nr:MULTISPECIES: hypothetical protein [unclassified Massilia]ALK97911.1 hypothetical protein AM586_18590 [Massilia sp. WG5]KNZ67667.1 hypothetical protein AB595_24455 [Massilia sp. WF1]